MKKNVPKGVYSSLFLRITLISFITFTCGYCMNNGLPLYVTAAGESAVFAGSLTSVFSLTAIFGRIVSGGLSDKIGRKPVLLYGASIIALAFLLPLFFPGYWFLPAFMGILGIHWSVVTTAASASVADIVSRDRLGEGMGFFSLGQALAMAIGPALASWMLEERGSNFMFSGMVCVAGVSVFIILSCRGLKGGTGSIKEDTPREKGALCSVIYRKAVPFSIANMFFRMAAAIMLSFISMYSEENGIQNSRYFFAVEAAAMILTRLFTGKIVDKNNANIVLVPAVVLGAVSFFMLCGEGSFVMLMGSALCYGLSLGTIQPLMNTLIIRNAEPGYYGRASATYILFADVGTAIGAYLWGKVLDVSASFDAVFCGGGLCVLLCGIIGFVLILRGSATNSGNHPIY